METIWSKRCSAGQTVLPEYPRPQLVRDSYINLNGIWAYAITDGDAQPSMPDGNILVPFSPESALSGVQRQLLPGQTLHYSRTFAIPKGFCRGRVLLHFGAVDQCCEVLVNGVSVGRHTGGYLPFSFDITAQLRRENTLVVRVTDDTDASYHARGKQKTVRGGIWYTPQSGIWQTVWLESVPEAYIESLVITPHLFARCIELKINASADMDCTVTTDGRSMKVPSNISVSISIPEPMEWSPAQPFLYDLAVTMGEDRVESYYAMRAFSAEPDEHGVPRLFLNGRPFFHIGVLDQGYWSDGMYTAPCEEAMEYDIRTVKQMGFNMIRKHIKIEPLRWYHLCDRLGMLVWQDMPNGGGMYKARTVTAPLLTGRHRKDHDYARFARSDEAGREEYRRELDETVRLLYNAPCIAMWVPFNEGWGQFDAADAVRRIEKLDKTRTVDHASGWHDQGAGDVKSLHVYFKKYRFHPDKKRRAVVLSEFGGYNCRIAGHCFNEKDYGYKRFASREAFMDAYEKLICQQIVPAKAKGLSAMVYTQLSDVEDELNGLLTYDRQAVKLDIERAAKMHAALL